MRALADVGGHDEGRPSCFIPQYGAAYKHPYYRHAMTMYPHIENGTHLPSTFPFSRRFMLPTYLHQAGVGLTPAYKPAYTLPTYLHADTHRRYTGAVRRTGNDTRTRIEARQRLYW